MYTRKPKGLTGPRWSIICESYNDMPDSPWPMLMGRNAHGSSEPLEEAFLHQLVSSPPESADADPQTTVWNTLLLKKEGVAVSLKTRAGMRDVFPVSGQDDQ